MTTMSVSIIDVEALARARFVLGSRSAHGPAHVREMDASGFRVPRAITEYKRVAGARTYWIADDMVELACHAARSMPRQVMLASDLPCPSGIAFFERGRPVPDIHGKVVVVNAILWTVASFVCDPSSGEHGTLAGVGWSYYSDPRDPRDEYLTAEEKRGQSGLR